MPKYTINGKTFRSNSPLSDSDLEALAQSTGAPAPVETTPEAPAPEPRSEWDAVKGAVSAIRAGEPSEQGWEDVKQASSLPARGFKGVGVASERAILGDDASTSLSRGTEASKPGYEPKDGEKLGAFAGDMADPRALPLNVVGGKALGLAGSLVKKAATPVGKVAAEGVEMLTGVHPHNTMELFEKPGKIVYAKARDLARKLVGKSAGKDMQAAKIAAGVTPEEERLIAQVDLGGYKKVADDIAKKVAGGDKVSIGEALAGKKAAGKVSTKGEGSAKAIYGKDRAKFAEILEESAPEVAKAQAEVAKVKTADAFLSPFARKGGSAKGHFVRNVLGGGLLASGNPAGMVFSPLTAGLATLLASGVTKGGAKAANNPVTRQALAALLLKQADKKD